MRRSLFMQDLFHTSYYKCIAQKKTPRGSPRRLCARAHPAGPPPPYSAFFLRAARKLTKSSRHESPTPTPIPTAASRTHALEAPTSSCVACAGAGRQVSTMAGSDVATQASGRLSAPRLRRESAREEAVEENTNTPLPPKPLRPNLDSGHRIVKGVAFLRNYMQCNLRTRARWATKNPVRNIS